jgi:hydroxymethylbilane synthase
LTSNILPILPQNKKILVGTRGSLLAVTQTKLVMDLLQKANPGLEYEIIKIKTSGDEGKDVLGAFVKEVEQALKNGQIHLAVHSLKDMPTQLPSGVCIGAMPFRGEHRDCLVSKDKLKFNELAIGAKIGTSSLRRAYQLKELRPDIEVVPIHGNIITRMKKVEDGTLDAVVLAAAGIERVDMEHKISHIFSEKEMLPAVSQGILALEVREDDAETMEIVKAITDIYSEHAAAAERSFLLALGGGCRMPIGGYARMENNEMVLDGIMFNEDGSRFEMATLKGEPEHSAELGSRLGKILLERFGQK